MEKPILYCDCDGVIFNTIDVAFQIMQDAGCDMNNKREIDYYFSHILNWNDIFSKATIINDSIDKIKLLKESNIFSDVIILTKLSGSYDEEGLKREIFRDYLPSTKVITLQFGLSKAGVVNAQNNVLIDDELHNCNNWKDNNGVAILFSQKNADFRKNIVNDLLDIPNTKGVKKLLKTRKI